MELTDSEEMREWQKYNFIFLLDLKHFYLIWRKRVLVFSLLTSTLFPTSPQICFTILYSSEA